MEEKIKYWSWAELDSIEAHKRRHDEPLPSSMPITEHEDYVGQWAAKIRKHDPDGRKARELAAEYSD